MAEFFKYIFESSLKTCLGLNNFKEDPPWIFKFKFQDLLTNCTFYVYNKIAPITGGAA